MALAFVSLKQFECLSYLADQTGVGEACATQNLSHEVNLCHALNKLIGVNCTTELINTNLGYSNRHGENNALPAGQRAGQAN